MNNTNDIFITAIQSIAESLTTQQKYDRTIQVVIYNPANVEEREYDVKYQNTLFRVYAKEGETYKTGDTVYVKIPEKDFSQKIYIEGIVAADSGMPIDKTKIIWTSPANKNQTYFFFRRHDSYIDNPLPDLSKKYDNLFVKQAVYGGNTSNPFKYKKNTPILTKWCLTYFDNNPEEEIEFNLKFFIKKENGEKTYIGKTYGINDFSGNPYNWKNIGVGKYNDINNVAFQDLIISFPVDLNGEDFGFEVIGNDKISLYSLLPDGANDGLGNYTDEIVPRVGVTPYFYKFGEVVSLNENEAYLAIYTPNGNNLNTTDGIKLEGKYVEKGKEIIPDEIQWYKANPTGYSSDIGQGWSTISGATNLNYSPKKAGKYLLFIKKDDIILTTTVEVIDEVKIVNDEGVLSLSNGAEAKWTMDQKESPTWTTGETYSPNKTGTVYCQLGDGTGTILTYEAFVQSDSGPDYEIRWQGRECFLYDVDGYSIDRFDEKEWTLRPSVYTSKDAYKLTLTWLAPDGEELISNKKYSPENYALKEMWVDSENVLHFTVPRNLSWQDCRNGRFTLNVKDAEGNEADFDKEIILIRQGETGTNGNGYVAVLRPNPSWRVLAFDTNGFPINLFSFEIKDSEIKDGAIDIAKKSITTIDNNNKIVCLYPTNTDYRFPLYIMYDTNGYNPKYDKAGVDKSFVPDNSIGDNFYQKIENSGGIIAYVLKYHNIYGSEVINEWDGITTTVGNNSILAQQIIAGEKNSNGAFTGLVMGKDSQQDDVGLYGYSKGINSFGLLADGTAYFGALETGLKFTPKNGDTPSKLSLVGNIELTGNITWTTNSNPVKILYSTSTDATTQPTAPTETIWKALNDSNLTNNPTTWSLTYKSSYYWASYSYDGGKTWGETIKITGKDGEKGANAYIPGYITETIIGEYSIQASQIKSNLITIYTQTGTEENNGLNLAYCPDLENPTYTYTPLSIQYDTVPTPPIVRFKSPAGTNLSFDNFNTIFLDPKDDIQISKPICGDAWGYGTSKPTETAKTGQLYFQY